MRNWPIHPVAVVIYLYLFVFIVIFLAVRKADINSDFFGAKVVGPYVQRAEGSIECARVQINSKTICKCHVVADSLLHDKAYLTAENKSWCNPKVKFPND